MHILDTKIDSHTPKNLYEQTPPQTMAGIFSTQRNAEKPVVSGAILEVSGEPGVSGLILGVSGF